MTTADGGDRSQQIDDYKKKRTERRNVTEHKSKLANALSSLNPKEDRYLENHVREIDLRKKVTEEELFWKQRQFFIDKYLCDQGRRLSLDVDHYPTSTQNLENTGEHVLTIPGITQNTRKITSASCANEIVTVQEENNPTTTTPGHVHEINLPMLVQCPCKNATGESLAMATTESLLPSLPVHDKCESEDCSHDGHRIEVHITRRSPENGTETKSKSKKTRNFRKQNIPRKDTTEHLKNDTVQNFVDKEIHTEKSVSKSKKMETDINRRSNERIKQNNFVSENKTTDVGTNQEKVVGLKVTVDGAWGFNLDSPESKSRSGLSQYSKCPESAESSPVQLETQQNTDTYTVEKTDTLNVSANQNQQEQSHPERPKKIVRASETKHCTTERHTTEDATWKNGTRKSIRHENNENKMRTSYRLQTYVNSQRPSEGSSSASVKSISPRLSSSQVPIVNKRLQHRSKSAGILLERRARALGEPNLYVGGRSPAKVSVTNIELLSNSDNQEAAWPDRHTHTNESLKAQPRSSFEENGKQQGRDNAQNNDRTVSGKLINRITRTLSLDMMLKVEASRHSVTMSNKKHREKKALLLMQEKTRVDGTVAKNDERFQTLLQSLVPMQPRGYKKSIKGTWYVKK